MMWRTHIAGAISRLLGLSKYLEKALFVRATVIPPSS